jgi:hypothetical protein
MADLCLEIYIYAQDNDLQFFLDFRYYSRDINRFPNSIFSNFHIPLLHFAENLIPKNSFFAFITELAIEVYTAHLDDMWADQ